MLAFLEVRIDGAYGIVDKHLSSSQWLVGDAPTIADFSLSGYLFYPVDESGIDVAKSHPHIGAWVQRLRRIDGWGDPTRCCPASASPTLDLSVAKRLVATRLRPAQAARLSA